MFRQETLLFSGSGARACRLTGDSSEGSEGVGTRLWESSGTDIVKAAGVFLEKVPLRENLKPRVCLRNIPRHSDSPEGELFSDITQGFSTICQTLEKSW